MKLAKLGTLLVWIPLILPLFFGVVSLIMRGQFRFDYLMPGELYWLILAGGIMLVIATRRAKLNDWKIYGGLGGSIATLASVIGWAQASGLAKGEVGQNGGVVWGIMIGLMVLFWITNLVLGWGGIRLIWGSKRKERV